MFEDRAPDPISRLGPTRDRPFEATHFQRVEEGRRASGQRSGQDRRGGARPATRPAARQATVTAAPEAPVAPEEAPSIGTHLDVRA